MKEKFLLFDRVRAKRREWTDRLEPGALVGHVAGLPEAVVFEDAVFHVVADRVTVSLWPIYWPFMAKRGLVAQRAGGR